VENACTPYFLQLGLLIGLFFVYNVIMFKRLMLLVFAGFLAINITGCAAIVQGMLKISGIGKLKGSC